MSLKSAQVGVEYRIKTVDTEDDELNKFLFSLGCYGGEPITVISRRRGTCFVVIKDTRYCIDANLANCILI